MGTKIEWTDESWNPIRARNLETGRAGHFCVHKSPGCANCYAETMQARLFGNPIRYAAQDAEKVEIFIHQHALDQPSRWRRPRRIFVCSMTDLFYEGHNGGMIAAVFAMMETAHWHTFQVLTKRPERMRQWLRDEWYSGKVLPNVWLGVSVEDQAHADERISILRDTPAAVRFVSAEPLLGPINLERGGLDWVIVGGESGAGARPMNRHWAAEIRDQCQTAGVPFFFKQWGEFAPVCAAINEPSGWDGLTMRRVGKKRAGRLLDGREWNEVPT